MRFMDNLSGHSAANVAQQMQELNIEPIWNAVYSPQFNPIEMSFSKVKLHFKKDKLQRLVHKKALPLESMVRTAFTRVTRENICNYVEHCYKVLR